MSKHSQAEPRLQQAQEAGAALLAIGGLGAAFGAASCCALPLILGSLSMGTAWLGALADLAAPYRLLLVVVAAACIATAMLLLWRGQAACAAAGDCGRPVVRRFTALGLAAAAILGALGLLYA
jgi:mercuric ion transport protein